MNLKFLFQATLVVMLIGSSLGCVNSPEATTGGVAGGVLINHDRRTAGEIVDDQAIGIKANLAISKDKNLWRQSHITTMSYNGTLLLVGQTASNKMKTRVEQLLDGIPEIEKIHNQITVGPLVNASTRMHDTWITTQVKTKILASREVGPNRVKVVTEDGKVYLMGALTTDEAEIVTELVSKIKGVEEVVTIFEDID